MRVRRWRVHGRWFGLLLATYCTPLLSGKAQQTASPPGELVDIGGRRLHLWCTGSGAPTVLIESGAGAFAVDWALVQPLVARTTRVCTYDRAGYGWSDRGPLLDLPDQVMSDLRLVLRAAKIAPPYVLVGASIGAIFVRDYQRRYPEDVVGMVLVDPTHDERLAYVIDGHEKGITEITESELRTFTNGIVARNPSPPTSPAVVSEPYDRLPEDVRAAHLWAMGRYFGNVEMQQVPFTAEGTRLEFVSLRRLRLASPAPLGSMPLVVLVNGASSDTTGQRFKRELAALSRNGTVDVVAGSCHEIHICTPDRVVRAIRSVVERARVNLGPHTSAAPSPSP